MSHSLGNATKARFMQRVSEFSTRGSKRGVNLLGWEMPEYLTPAQEYECLKLRVRSLEEVILTYPDGSDVRRQLGLEKCKIQQRIQAIRPSNTKFPDLGDYIIKIVQHRYTKAQWKIILEQARRMKQEEESKARAVSPRPQSAQSSTRTNQQR